MRYIILRDFYIGDLSTKVEEWCRRGYRPHGSPVVEAINNSVHYLQAMIKEED